MPRARVVGVVGKDEADVGDAADAAADGEEEDCVPLEGDDGECVEIDSCAGSPE